MQQPARIAVDLGAESCRVSLLRWDNNQPSIQVIHRIANGPIHRGPCMHWPLATILAGIEAGLRKAAEAAQAAAAEKIKQYQEALKQARAKVYIEQEAARKRVLDERAELLKEARRKGAAEVGKAKERVAKELDAARHDIETTIAQLSVEIARRVVEIPPQRPPSSPAKGAQ